jgi:thiol-disulfide isomerase/thioredoxin
MFAIGVIAVVLSLGAVLQPGAARGADGVNTRRPTPNSQTAPGRNAPKPDALDVGSRASGVDSAERLRVVSAALEQFSATDLAGRRWTAADLGGRVVLLDFWATWCAPCLADLPLLQALRQEHPRDDFEILGISLDVTSRRAFVSWLNRHRIEWPQIHLRQGYAADVPTLFGVEQLPSTVVIDRAGRVAGIDVRGDRLVAVVNALVGDTP